jgi:DNA-binding XRE family transcriptional regulator
MYVLFLIDKFPFLWHGFFMSEKDNPDTQKRKKRSDTKYIPELHNKIAEIGAKVGLTDVELAKEIGIARSTLALWKKEFPEFGKILRNRKKYADDKVVQSLYKRAQGYTVVEDHVVKYKDSYEIIRIKKHIASDPTSMIFWLKNRQPENWRDRHDINVSGNIDYKAQRKKVSGIFKKLNNKNEDE